MKTVGEIIKDYLDEAKAFREIEAKHRTTNIKLLKSYLETTSKSIKMFGKEFHIEDGSLVMRVPSVLFPANTIAYSENEISNDDLEDVFESILKSDFITLC